MQYGRHKSQLLLDQTVILDETNPHDKAQMCEGFARLYRMLFEWSDFAESSPNMTQVMKLNVVLLTLAEKGWIGAYVQKYYRSTSIVNPCNGLTYHEGIDTVVSLRRVSVDSRVASIIKDILQS